MSEPVRQHLQVEMIDGVAVVRFLGKEIREVFGEHADVQEIGDELYSLVDQKNQTRLLLEFSEVQYMASYMLGKLVGLKRKVQKAGGQLKLCRLNPPITEIFRVSGLDRVFDIYADEHSALDAFERNG